MGREGEGKRRGEERTITLVAVRCSTSQQLVTRRLSLVARRLWLVDLAWSLLYVSLGMPTGGREVTSDGQALRAFRAVQFSSVHPHTHTHTRFGLARKPDRN